MTTQRVPNVHDVWNTLGSRCTNVAGLLGTGRNDKATIFKKKKKKKMKTSDIEKYLKVLLPRFCEIPNRFCYLSQNNNLIINRIYEYSKISIVWKYHLIYFVMSRKPT